MLHDFISAHRTEILDFCLQDLKNRYPGRDDEELISEIPCFVDEVIDALRADHSSQEINATDLGITTARQQGFIRKSQGFDLSRLVHDYGLVCDAVSQMAVKYSETVLPREFQVLNRCVDEGIARSIESFEETRSTEEKNRAEHLGFVIHEIRNAVGNASLAFELIRKGKAGFNGSTADVVQRALGRIANLVAESLAEARLIGAIAQREWQRLDDLFEQVIADNRPERPVQIEVKADEGLVIDVDQRLLSSAIDNLLRNAIKFTPDYETIILRGFSIREAVAIEVEDRCGGISETSTESLFKPFFQERNDRRGTGLGLAIARRAVEAHGGTLTARNLPGLGCVFTILIPQTTRILDK